MLERLAHFCYTRRRLVLALWILALFGMTIVGRRLGDDFEASFSLPDSDARRAFEVLEDRFPSQAGDVARVVFRSQRSVTDPSVKQPMEALFAELAGFEHVTEVVSPYTSDQAGFSQDRTVGFAPVQFDRIGPDLPQETILAIRDKVDATSVEGVEIALGGEAVRFAEEGGPGNRESIGIIAAIIILLITFGSVIAMGLPIITAIFGLGIGIGFLGLFALVLEIPEFAPQLAAMIGLGVGIDYALFIVTRYRQGLHAGMDPYTAVVVAVTTAGRAVVFAGITVVISLLGLFLIGLAFVRGLAVSASMTVLITMIASITLLPAILGFAGRAIDRLRVPVLHRDESEHRQSVWFRWSRVIQRRPWPAALAGILVLVVIALPLFAIRLGFSDAGNDPPTAGTRRAYDMLAEGFGPGFNGPLVLAAELDAPAQRSELTSLAGGLLGVEGVALALPPRLSPDERAAVIVVIPESAPQDEETAQLVRRLREEVIPAEIGPDGPQVYVGGVTAAFRDMSDYLQRRLGYFIGAVVVLSFLLLMVVFRSLLIPLKAAIVNLLGIGAAYGVVVAIFQWGWISELFGVSRTGPIEPFLPMMLFAILFGLSMDYEVFLMSRIREEYLRTGRNDLAVADGLAATARVITAAAAIMVTLFLSFVLGDERVIKLFGLGLAVAIFLDATLIRMVVVPSFMELAGDWNWWLPKWLDRLIPRVSVEAAPQTEAVPAPSGAPPASGRQPRRKPAARKPKPAARKPKPAARKAKPAARKAKPAARKAKPAAARKKKPPRRRTAS